MKTLFTTRKIDLRNSYIIKNKNVFILFLVMMSAVIFGFIMHKYSIGEDVFADVIDICGNYMASAKNNSKPEIFWRLLLSAFACYAAIMLLSSSIIGEPLIYTVIFFKITGLSTILFALYSEFGLSGIEYSALVILPGKYFMILSLIILADYSSQLCKLIVKDIQNKAEQLKKFIIILILTAAIMLISVAIDFFTLTTFAGLFDFNI